MQLPPLREEDGHRIQRFLDAIWAEQGLARATLDSYRRDLEGLARWASGRACAPSVRAPAGERPGRAGAASPRTGAAAPGAVSSAQGSLLAGIDRPGLFDYLAWRTHHGWSPRSNARLLSALRAFFADCLRRGERGGNDRCSGMPARDPVAVVEVQRCGGRGIAPDGPGETAALPCIPDRQRTARHQSRRHPASRTRAGRRDPRCRRRHEIEHAAAGGLPQFRSQRAFAGGRDIGGEMTDDLHGGCVPHRQLQRGFSVVASVIGGARFIAPLSS